MKVVILSDNILKASLIYNQIKDLPNITFYALICNNQKLDKIKFLYIEIRYLFKLLKKGFIQELLMLLKLHWKINLEELSSVSAINWLKTLSPDIGLHAASIIYRSPIIKCFKLGILNPHIGILPAYRGRCVMEWSILNGDSTGITTFFIDEGIDTGKNIVLREEIDVSKFQNIDEAKEYLFSLDVEMFRKALITISNEDYKPIYQDNKEGKRYYVMSSLLKKATNDILNQNKLSK